LSESWAIYDRLLQGIPGDAVVASCLVGRSWSVVDSGWMGIAMTHHGDSKGSALRPPHAGRRLSDMAAYLKSWNLYEASLGMAAVNSFYNTPDRIASWLNRPLDAVRGRGALTDMLDNIAGKKVAVIGHFPGIEATAANCTLTVLERNPQDGDLPDFAAEYVLPDQDFVFITGLTVANKTLPRLLTLSAQATVVLMGPSVPLVPWWFDHGVDVLAGMVVIDREHVWRYCQEGGTKGPFDNGGWMVQITRDDMIPGTGAPAGTAARGMTD
jgi:uncharacterized protein (DUF4213/DUF364 family)